jgi:uncharacterized protein (DUF1499 family)
METAMILAWVCFYDAWLAIVVIAAGMICAHFRLVPPFAGFQLMLAGLVFAALGLITGLIALPMTIFSAKRRPARGRALMGTVFSLLILIPIVLVLAKTHRYPLINDITTDPDHPPVFVMAVNLQPSPGRDMTYNPPTAAIQKAAPAYADLAPLKIDGPPDEVFKKVQILAGEDPAWQVTRNDPQTHTLEGVATSRLFRFHDDFIIEVRPAAGSGSLVEMRSKSRDGTGDLGVNYHRIVRFLNYLKTGPQTLPPGSAQVQP